MTRNQSARQARAEAIEILSHDARILDVCAGSSTSSLSFVTDWIKSQEIDGIRVYVGRFYVEINVEPGKFTATWLEAGCGEHCRPRYVISSNEFCFGERVRYIEGLVSHREYLGAAYAILDSLSQVNPMPEDRAFYLREYRRVQPTPSPHAIIERKLLPWHKRLFRRESR